MRLIWTCENIDQLRAFSRFLTEKAIAFSIEEQVNKNWESDQYGTKKFLLWIHNEDQIPETMRFLSLFLESPQDPLFAAAGQTNQEPFIETVSPVTKYLENKLHLPLYEPEKKLEGFSFANLTTYILLLCCFIFLLEFSGEEGSDNVPAETKASLLAISPVKKALMFDYPHSYEILDKIITSYGYGALTNPKDLPPASKFLYEQYRKEPLWQGYYPYMLSWAKNTFTNAIVPMPPLHDMKLFEKIQQGEVWRLVTPAYLHNDLLHLFFNMIWLLLLGSQIESRTRWQKYLLLITILAIITNTAQYLMTGPNFIGFSGVICGMATFIRVRQKTAPWEGYQLSSSTFSFICFFIGTLAALSFLTFLLNIFGNISLPIAIANTAHLVGAFAGYALGRMKFFSWHTLS